MGPTGRRLYAIARVDIVGSTETLARRGVGVAMQHREQLAHIVATSLRETDGSIVTTEGDGVVAAFGSSRDALVAAADVRDAADDTDFDVRIGVTIGELAGDGVESLPSLARAAAIEARAAPGEIVIDALVRHCLTGLLDPALDPLPAPNGAHGPALGPLHRLDDTVSAESTTHLPATGLRAVMFTRIDAIDTGRTDTGRTAADGRSTLDDAIRESVAAIEVVGGKIVDTHGPGQVAQFMSCAAAIDAAERLHDVAAGLALRADPGSGSASAPIVSVAIAVGEVVASGIDEFGPPVVEAARLLGHADGATLISDDVRRLGGDAASAAVRVGALALKGLPEPVVAHRIEPPGAARPLLPLPQPLAREHRFAFAGRADEVGFLSATWTRVVAGDIQGVVVSGEEGAGKTRLVRELAREAHDQGALVLFGSCDEDLRAPYDPIRMALTPATALDDGIATAIEEHGPLAALVDHHPAASGAQPADRFALFDGVAAALGRLAARRPVLLLVDDIQWASADTVRLVEHALADPAIERLMIVATCRSEMLGREHPVEALLGSSRTIHRVAHRRLDRLHAEEVSAMLASRAGATDQCTIDHFAAQITTATGGSPLFVEELTVHLVATGALVGDDTWQLAVEFERIPLPDSVVDLMERRVDRLGDDAVSLLTTAAVIGSSFEVDLLAAVAERGMLDIVETVEIAAEAGLIHEDDGGTCTFGDEITREVLLRGVRPSRRAMTHRRVAEVVEARRPDAIDALARHWDLAIGDDARDRAIEYLQRSADRDMAAAAWESAIARLRRLVERLDEIDPFADSSGGHAEPRRGEAHYGLGFCLRMLGDDTYRPDLVAAASIARATADAGLLARCATAMMRPGAWYPEAGIVDDQISEMCDDALLLLAPDDPLRARVLALLAINLAYDGDDGRRWTLVVEAQRLAREHGDLQLVGTTLAAELIACQEPDQFEHRWRLADEVRRIGRASGDRDLEFAGGFFVMLEHTLRGEIHEAAAIVEDLQMLADRSRAYWPRFLIAHFDTSLAIARCHPGAADLIEAERAKFEPYPVDWFGISVIQNAVLAMARGSLSDMLLPFAAVMEQNSDASDWARKWNYAFAKAYLDSGDLDAAVAAVEANPDPDFDRYWVSSLHHLGLLGLTLGRTDYCERVLRELGPYRGRLSVVGVGACITGQVSTALGQAALGLDDLDAAEELFREAIEQADALEFPYFATTARRFLATTLLRRNPDNAEGQALLDTVAAAADRHGFAIEARAVRQLRDQP